jgi:hypothetical protein
MTEERLINKHQRKNSLICHSERSEESPDLLNFSHNVLKYVSEKLEKRKFFASCRATSLKVSLSSVELSEQSPLKNKK